MSLKTLDSLINKNKKLFWLIQIKSSEQSGLLCNYRKTKKPYESKAFAPPLGLEPRTL